MEEIFKKIKKLKIKIELQTGLIRSPIGTTSEHYVANKFNDLSEIQNTAHVEFNVRNLDNVRFLKLNSYPAVGVTATAEYYVDQSIEAPGLAKKKRIWQSYFN